MTESTAALGFTAESFEAFLTGRDEPIWLTDLRNRSWGEFQNLPIPSKQEEWRRTDLRLLRLDRFAPPVVSRFQKPSAAAMKSGVLTHGVELGGTNRVFNGHPIETSLLAKLASQGVLFGNLDELICTHEELLKPFFSQAVEMGGDKFNALHYALWSGGTLLYVPRGVCVAEPFHTLSELAGGSDFSHTLVILEEGAEATLLAETTGDGQPALHSGAIELILRPGSRLRYVNLQDWGRGTWHFAHQAACLHENSSLQWTIGALGSRLAKVNQHVHLKGRGAEAQVNGVMFTEDKQHLSYNTLQWHHAPECRSDLLYKGALQDSSRMVWRGMIKVAPEAQKTDAYQRDDNLMLSHDARADSIPGLEIEADDVRCTHGATAGQVDLEQIFYAQCRGLTRNEAVRMIVAGFFQQIFDRISIESVRNALGEAIGEKIHDFR